MHIFQLVILAGVLLAMIPGYGNGQEQKNVPSAGEIRALLSAAAKKNDGNKTITELSRIGDPIVPSLIEILHDKNEDHKVRAYAVGIVSAIKDIDAVELLIEYLNDKDWLIRDGVEYTLNNITGISFGKDEKKWREWWAIAKPKYVSFVGDCINPEVKKFKNDEPCWLIKKIAREEMGSPANPPASISKCVFKNKAVYYKPPRCCDIPSKLWDENGVKICSPDGGESGSGDGKCPDFLREKRDCLIIWKDTHSSR